LDRAFLPHKLF
jgi:hypothetical protein